MAAATTAAQYEAQIKRMKLLAKSQTTFLKSSLQNKIKAGAELVKKSIEALTEAGSSSKIDELKSGLVALKLQELDVDVAAADVELKEEIAILRGEIERMETGGASAPIPPPKGSSAPLPPPPVPAAAVAAAAAGLVIAQMSAEDAARLKSVEAENASLRNLLKEAQTELASSKSAVSAASSGDSAQLAQLKSQIKQVEADAASKIASLEQSLKAASSGKGGVEAEVARLNAELSKVQAALEKSKADANDALNKRTSELNALIAQKVQETEKRLEAEKEEMMEAVSQEIDEIEKTKISELAALEKAKAGELAALEKSKSAEMASLVAAKASLEDQLSKAMNSTQAVTGGLVSLMKKAKTLAAEYKKSNAAIKAELAEYKSGIKSQVGGALIGKINALQQQLSVTNSRYLKEMVERKKLHNLIQELKGNIRVYMRCRPPSKKEIAEFGSDGALCVSFPNPGEVKVLNEKSREKSWEFDEVFDTSSTQQQVYNEVSALVTSVMDGYNVCILAYGQTGSGKTWTMQGPAEDRGVNLRALEELIQRANDRSDEYDDTISISILEVYNEEIHDLLVEGGSQEKLEIRQSERGNYVPNLVSHPVTSMRNVLDALSIAEKNRSVTATNMNEHSSRSHMMLQIALASLNKTSGQTTRGKLSLVDLAGSERINKSGATGQALKEAQNINQSLSALGDVIAARANKAAHIPFRNSKLTYLLQVR
jgi:kinesin family protein C2/C3